jgi:transcriptional regulator with XRE-family HTH domain
MEKRFKELRLERKLTLRELAEYIGINYSTIACYETNKREPNIETLKKLISFFEVSLDYICGDDKYIYVLYENSNQKL